ncbi:class I SAM-dependent methyltransferase [Chloroflexota bacterium]
MSRENDTTFNVRNNGKERDKIIQYWNYALLCSLESSTSHTHPDLAYLDNAIENHVLAALLDDWMEKSRIRCLDVGAGYGRFANLFRQNYLETVLLEPAERIFSKLSELWSGTPNIRCVNKDFELYSTEDKYDLIFVSGVVYLYRDSLLDEFMRKATSMLTDGGLLVFRDFISESQPQIIKSSYINDSFCYYRTIEFWINYAKLHKVKLLDIKRSKPQLSWLRNSRTIKVLSKFKLTRLYRNAFFINAIIHLGNFKIDRGGLQTVYIGMKKS